jgi:hypothetical protein
MAAKNRTKPAGSYFVRIERFSMSSLDLFWNWKGEKPANSLKALMKWD